MPVPNPTVTAIATTPVKGLALHAREQVQLTELGVADDRVFFLVDERGTLINNKRCGELMQVRADLDAAGSGLTLTFPDGHLLAEEVDTDAPTTEVRFFSSPMQVQLVCPRLSAELSQFTGQQLRLVRADPQLTAIDRGPRGAISLISRGSLERLGELAGERIDGRRFRMLFEIDGVEPHAEDELVGRDVRIGAALVRFNGHVGRCRVTKLDPDSGAPTLETLDLIGSYRSQLASTEPLPFGVYGEVLEPGVVRVGDAVSRAA